LHDPVGVRMLQEGGAAIEVVDSPDAAAIKAALGHARALYVRTPGQVTAAVLDAGPELVVVSTSGFGTDNIDIEAATARGILVVNHRGFGRVPVAEHTILLILAAVKGLVRADAAARDGSGWRGPVDAPAFELDGKCVGIVGLGHVGAELARKLRLGFRCRVLAYDPYVDPRLPLVTDVEMCAELDDLLAQAQVLCLVPALTEETRGLIGTRELARLPAGAVVVNTGRGRVLDLDALAAALDSGHLAAAGIDVFYPEPPPLDHPLFRHPRATLTPHIAGLSKETAQRSARSVAEQILAALGGEMPRFPVNPGAWQRPASRRPAR